MKPEQRFLNQPKDFWANVRTVSEAAGYTARGTGQIRVLSLADIASGLLRCGLCTSRVVAASGNPTEFGTLLVAYFAYRAQVLNDYVKPRLMNGRSARALFITLKRDLKPRCPLPMNKQRGKKKAPAYLTGIVNMLIEANAGGRQCNFDPKGLTTVTRDDSPLRTMARRVDGAFPGILNPIAVWEIKEYYYTTTFGSRVADGVYESLLDGMEIEELREHENVDVKHYLMVDARYTWWECGKSYLCRLIDMLHMGYVDEVLFGREVVERLPSLAREWVALLEQRAVHETG